MAQYNREILVPYLQDICALHLAERKLTSMIYNLNQKINALQKGKYNPVPVKSKVDLIFAVPFIFSVICGYLLFRFVKWSLTIPYMADFFESWKFTFRWNRFGGMLVIALLSVFILLGIGVTIIFIFGVRDEKKNYHKAVITYKEIEESNQSNRRQIPKLQGEVQKYKVEREKVKALLQKAYNANIIPRRYRDLYASVYLYDWFSTSRATDLDMALNMYVLEQIKDKLDTIIRNQSEIILNQRIIMANQQQAMVQQKRNSAIWSSKLNQIAESNEERNMYLDMIESNTAATAYFAALNYARR